MAASGREDTAGTWLAAYRLPLVGYVLPLVDGDLQAAEDVVQETMIRGWQHEGELHRQRAGSWLHTVARNLAISTYHRRRRARPREVPLDDGLVPAAGDGLDSRMTKARTLVTIAAPRAAGSGTVRSNQQAQTP